MSHTLYLYVEKIFAVYSKPNFHVGSVPNVKAESSHAFRSKVFRQPLENPVIMTELPMQFTKQGISSTTGKPGDYVMTELLNVKELV